MSAEYRVALIGCGGISHWHAKGYLDQGNVKIVAACDINQENLNRVCDQYQIPGRYPSHEALFDREKGLDLVSICTYPKAHAAQTIAAANAGARAVLCEKPMCLGVDEAEAMIEACRKNGAKLSIAFRHRQNPNFTKARELVVGGTVGEPRMIWAYLTLSIIDNGGHVMDMMRYILGDPEAEWVMGQVERKKDSVYQGSPIEEAGMGLVQFKGGARGVIEMGERVPADGFHFRVWGSEGVLEATTSAVKLLGSGGAQSFEAVPTKGFTEQAGELIRWLEGGPEHRSTGEKNGLACTEILMAIHESARVRGAVRLPLKVKGYPMLKMAGESR